MLQGAGPLSPSSGQHPRLQRAHTDRKSPAQTASGEVHPPLSAVICYCFAVVRRVVAYPVDKHSDPGFSDRGAPSQVFDLNDPAQSEIY